ncbi:nitrite reductase small subunit NirD [Aliikangiella sp. G2MR2-5]|uniref:nitrite reductase small subunit NirD n=1 Tax=Aliikangiella sp. G2MR2-5 TaxID=2788943 RepID=UPI0018AA5FE3|nr:nitrite reductase small subunit NirD [Aliikangiella sp. G2MR2-5]
MQSQWQEICELDDIYPHSGVCAEVNGRQVAIFRLSENSELRSIENFDPIAKANILSRGIIGERNGKPVVFSPLYKHPYCLDTGVCLEDEGVSVPVYSVKTLEEKILIRVK